MTDKRLMGLYVISVAAELAGVHPQTLRIYERKGLLEPSRTQGGSRRYSEEDIARLQRIAELTAMGLNLEGAKRVMDLEDENERLRQMLAQARLDATQTRAQIAEAVEAVRRENRRDLVPVRQWPAPMRRD